MNALDLSTLIEQAEATRKLRDLLEDTVDGPIEDLDPTSEVRLQWHRLDNTLDNLRHVIADVRVLALQGVVEASSADIGRALRVVRGRI